MARSKEQRKAETADKVANFNRDNWKYAFLRGLIDPATVPLLVPTSRGGALEPVSTGVMTKLRDHVFIFTAQHSLLALGKGPIFIPTLGGRIREIEGHALGSTALDAGIMHIENKVLDPFLEIALPGGVVFAQDAVLTDNLILYGYPAWGYRRDKLTRQITCEPRLYQMKGLPEKFYARKGHKPEDHILINWPKKVLGDKGFVRSPKLPGMSGSGVWYLPQVNKRPLSLHTLDPMPRLVGIFTEQPPRQGMLIATNVRHHVRAVWQTYPELLERYKETYRERIAQMRHVEEEAVKQPDFPGKDIFRF